MRLISGFGFLVLVACLLIAQEGIVAGQEGENDTKTTLEVTTFSDVTASVEPSTTAASTEPITTAASTEPEDTTTSSEPGDTTSSIEPSTTAASTEPEDTTTSIEPTTTTTENTTTPTSNTSTEGTTTSTIKPSPTPPLPPAPITEATTQLPASGEGGFGTVWVILIICVVVIVLIVSSTVLVVYFFMRRRKHKRKPVVEHSQTEVVVPRSVPAKHYKSGDVIPGAPPPGPKGWEPDALSPKQFQHKGPLKIVMDQTIIMDHELENAPPIDEVSPHAVWNDQENIVFDIGSEVEEYYNNKGMKVPPPKGRLSKTSTPKRKAQRVEAMQMKALRED